MSAAGTALTGPSRSVEPTEAGQAEGGAPRKRGFVCGGDESTVGRLLFRLHDASCGVIEIRRPRLRRHDPIGARRRRRGAPGPDPGQRSKATWSWTRAESSNAAPTSTCSPALESTPSFGVNSRATRLLRQLCQAIPQLQDLGLLRLDDLLGHRAQLRVLAVLELQVRHVYGALVVGDHHGGEIAVGIVGRHDVHALHHLIHDRHRLARIVRVDARRHGHLHLRAGNSLPRPPTSIRSL